MLYIKEKPKKEKGIWQGGGGGGGDGGQTNKYEWFFACLYPFCITMSDGNDGLNV